MRLYDVPTQRLRRPQRVLGYLRNEEQRNVRQQHQCKELEESMEMGASSSAAALMRVGEAVLADTRETQEALTVSALPQTHAMIQRASKHERNSLTSWRA